jgi:hypothetical protein
VPGRLVAPGGGMSRARRIFALGGVACPLLVAGAATTAAPSCRGAAALDPANGCRSPHTVAVAPHPFDALLEHGPPCIRLRARTVPPGSCWFPPAPRRARTTVALIGDSHAQSWRSAVSPLVASWRRRAVSMTVASCPFARVPRPNATDERNADCFHRAEQITEWLRRHPGVRTVFFVNSSSYDFVPTRDQGSFERGAAGYRAAFAALPRSVRQLVVIRDNPKMRHDTNDCVSRALRNGRGPGPACAVPKGEALRPDAAAAAAASTDDPRVRLVDLSDFFCDERLCYPAIGGVLVYKDGQHLARRYGRSLWRYLRARLG